MFNTTMDKASRTPLRALCVGMGLMAMSLASAAGITVAITDVQTEEGRLMVALYDNEQSFLKVEESVAAFSGRAQPGTRHVVFADLPPGRYAVAVMHDEDGDGELDTNMLGIPTEGYGFSGDGGGFGAPNFEEASVSVSDSEMRIQIRMRY